MGVAVLVFGVDLDWIPLLAGATLLGAVYVLLGFFAVVRYDSLNEALLPSAVWVTLLLAPVLGHFGVMNESVFFLHPSNLR